MNNERLNKQLEFLLEIDKEKSILRQSHKTDKNSENDAEHAWHSAIMIYLLREYANEEFDVLKAVVMSLIHDIVEIDAGDTYAYDNEGNSTKADRESKAAERIYGLLPKEQKDEMISLFNEFEEGKTPEAKFARVIDNLQPIMLNNYNDGNDWKRHNVTKSQIYKRNKITSEGSEVIWEYIKEIIDKNINLKNIKDE